MALRDRFKKFGDKKEVIIESDVVEYSEEILESGHIEIPLIQQNKPLIDIDDIFPQILKSLVLKVEGIPVWNEFSVEKRKELVTEFVNFKLEKDFRGVEISCIDREKLINRFLNSIYGFGMIDIFLADENVNSIVINGEKAILIEKDGVFIKSDVSLEDTQICSIIKKLGKPLNASVSNIRIDNLIITLVAEPVSQDGSKIIIRKNKKLLTGSGLVKKGFLSDEELNLLYDVIDEKQNILIAGKIGSGKTELMSALVNYFDVRKNAIILEDFSQMSFDISEFLKFETETIVSINEFEKLLSVILGLKADYIVSDISNCDYLNILLKNIDKECCISSARAVSEKEALLKIKLPVFKYVVTVENHKVISITKV